MAKITKMLVGESLVGDGNEVAHIDLIIGGHTHTFMEKPVVLKNGKGNDVIINQVGCFGLYLGQIDFFFDRNNKRSFSSSVLNI